MMGTLIVGLIVGLVIILAIRSIITDKKKRKSGKCDGDCKHCGLC